MGNYNSSYRGGGSYNRNNHPSGSSSGNVQSAPAVPYKELNSLDYVDTAEKVICSLNKKYIFDNKTKTNKEKIKLTTSQIRNLLSMTSEMLNKVHNGRNLGEANPPLTESLHQDLNSLRIRAIYECGRTDEIRDFVEKAHILEHLKNIKTINDCELFCHYMEALVAFHRYFGGEDH